MRSTERYSEIANVESAMDYIEQSISEGTEITHHFLRELHHLAVDGLNEEGDRTPGAYRAGSVEISQSTHLPPGHNSVQGYMDELLAFINRDEAGKYDLLKTAIAHHRFTWIHPFGNGNDRVVRLLTYAMLIKYGFNVKDGKIFNPTAVFCNNNRDQYYQNLTKADSAEDDAALLEWCDYVLTGILNEVTKANKLLDFSYLYKNILIPTIELGIERGHLNEIEVKILRTGIKKQLFKATDLDDALPELTSRQRTHQLAKMKEFDFIKPIKENSRTYHVNFTNNLLMRSLVRVLEREQFIPAIDQ